MKVTLNWLRELVPIELPLDRLADRLAMAGLEVEGISEQGAEPVTIAQITRIDPHPQSDHLVVCHVTTGGETMPVVCGATNMRVGDKVALAAEGTTLTGGQKVERGEIRGQVSCGMLCSEAELDISPDHSGLLILPAEAEVGQALFAFLGLRDTILDVAITPNRGDCLSVLGLAREIAALTGVRLHAQKPQVRERGVAITEQASVRIEDPDLCPRYAARVVIGVHTAPSPAWTRWRLEATGIRALNNLVDVTNYVMIERGQPLHAFDLPSLAGAEIVVRRARDRASIRTLDGQDRALGPDDLLICDRDRAVAIAGVMGGENSEVREQTTAVLLESAYFVPETVRRTARRLGVRSEASYRFERGVDPQGTVLALNRAAALLTQLAGGRVSRGVIDVCPQPLPSAQISLRARRVTHLLGVAVEPQEIKRCLRTLGMAVKSERGGAWRVTIPSYRADLTQEADLIEEIARLRGYETIPTLLPRSEVQEKKPDLEGIWSKQARAYLAAQGLAEMLNLSFTSARLNLLFPGLMPHVTPVTLINPLSAEDAEMRRSLLSNLVRALQLNLRQGEAGITVFELGKVFWQEEGSSGNDHRQERLSLAGVLYGSWPVTGIGQEGRRIDFADLKGILEGLWHELHYQLPVRWNRAGEVSFLHPGKAAMLSVNGTTLGVAGALHPTVCAELGLGETPWVFELDFAALLRFAHPVTAYHPLPRFPVVVRDLAVVVDEELPVQAVTDAISALTDPLIVSVRLFDLYRGEPIPTHKKSLAYSIAYRATDRTLTTSEVNALHAQVVHHLVQTLGVEVRA
ncbi:MAG TPA: phenylalanine--tRNA ligase subunit beta [Candidatus Binatia bacterium]|nr:phenylalanine--tRNA ligase subunit beta [Candidatus Binatia bacterium]